MHFLCKFICVLAILGRLCRLGFFKTVYLKTSNVRFESFFQNPVTITDKIKMVNTKKSALNVFLFSL